MAIPEGYRLLTSADIGKVFGVDLESMVYFDEDVTPTFYLTSIGELNLTNFCSEERGYLPVAEYNIKSGIYLNGSGYIYYEVSSISFSPTEADLSGVEITSFNTDYSWNNWLYVKDIEVADPYSIKIKNKEGIILQTKDKTIEYTDDVKITINESLLGGGEAKKYNFTLYQDSDPGGNSDQYYSVDGGAFEFVPYADNSVSLTGNTLVIFSQYYRTIGVYVTGGSFVGIKYNTSSTRYYVVVVTITEDNAEVHFSTYD